MEPLRSINRTKETKILKLQKVTKYAHQSCPIYTRLNHSNNVIYIEKWGNLVKSPREIPFTALLHEFRRILLLHSQFLCLTLFFRFWLCCCFRFLDFCTCFFLSFSTSSAVFSLFMSITIQFLLNFCSAFALLFLRFYLVFLSLNCSNLLVFAQFLPKLLISYVLLTPTYVFFFCLNFTSFFNVLLLFSGPCKLPLFITVWMPKVSRCKCAILF